MNYYIEKIFDYDYSSVYYIDTGRRSHNINESPEQTHEPSIFKLTDKLKEEANAIIDEWSMHPFFKNKSPGYAIYSSGRCKVAHGAGKYSKEYDYAGDYLFIKTT